MMNEVSISAEDRGKTEPKPKTGEDLVQETRVIERVTI